MTPRITTPRSYGCIAGWAAIRNKRNDFSLCKMLADWSQWHPRKGASMPHVVPLTLPLSELPQEPIRAFGGFNPELRIELSVRRSLYGGFPWRIHLIPMTQII
jgi:hypothetical protein